MNMTYSKLFELILRSLPYSDQITDIDLSDGDHIRFSWRGDRFRVSDKLMVEEVDDGMLRDSNEAILLGELLKTTKGDDK